MYQHYRRTTQVLSSNPDTGVTVSLAIDTVTNRHYAWKEYAGSIEFIQKVRRESEIQRKLIHNAINPLIEVVEETCEVGESVLVLISEMGERDLKAGIEQRRKKSQPWTESELTSNLSTLISALSYCQSLQIAHRDIKPANIFLFPGNSLKLGDFGSARELSPTLTSLTFEGTLMYLSPKLRLSMREMIETGKKPRHNAYKSDVYSLGVTFLHMARLEVPRKMGKLDGLEKTIESYLEELSYSQEFKAVLREMMKIEENDRPDFTDLQRKFTTMRTFEGNNKNKLCKMCANDGKFVCLCEFPVGIYCEDCLDRHKVGGNEHFVREIGDWIHLNDRKTVENVAKKMKIKEKVENGLNAALESIENRIKDVNSAFEAAISELKSQKAEITANLQLLQSRIGAISAKLSKSFDDFLYSPQKMDQFVTLNSIEMPYFHCNIRPIHTKLIEFELHEEISNLESMFLPPQIPIFHRNVMKIARIDKDLIWETANIDESKAIIDEYTSFYVVNNAIVVGCGGQTRSNQAFVINFQTKDIRFLSFTIFRRGKSGIIVFEGEIFLFGGNFSGKSAEKLSFSDSQSTNLGEMAQNRSEFNPASYKSEIYLPGAIFEIFTPQTSTFRTFLTMNMPNPLPISSLIYEERMLIFASNLTLSVSLSDKDRICDRVRYPKVGFFSNPSPVIIGAKAYFCDGDSGTILKIDLQKKTRE